MAGSTFALQTHISNVLQERLDKKVSAIKFANRMFEGVLSGKGSSVTVEDFPLVTLSTISDLGADLTAQTITATPYTITVAQAKGINIKVRDIEKIRAAFEMESSIIDNVITANAIEMETHFLSQVNSNVVAGNQLYEVAPITLASTTIIGYLDELIVKLAESNVTADQVVIYLPPAVAGMIRQSDLYRNTERGVGSVERGFLMNYAGAELYETNCGVANYVTAFAKRRPHFIQQLSQIEINKNPNAVGSLIVSENYYQADLVGVSTNAAARLKFA